MRESFPAASAGRFRLEFTFGSRPQPLDIRPVLPDDDRRACEPANGGIRGFGGRRRTIRRPTAAVRDESEAIPDSAKTAIQMTMNADARGPGKRETAPPAASRRLSRLCPPATANSSVRRRRRMQRRPRTPGPNSAGTRNTGMKPFDRIEDAERRRRLWLPANEVHWRRRCCRSRCCGCRRRRTSG